MKKVLQIILLILLSLNNVFPQSITFKKVFPAFPIDPNNFKITCNPFINDKSFLIIGSGMRLIKINENGTIILLKNYLHYGYFIHPYLKDNDTIIFYSDYGNNKKILKLDTSLSLISAIQIDSINTGWQDISFQFHVDNNSMCPTFDNAFVISGTKKTLIPLFVKIDYSDNIIWGRYLLPVQGGIQDIIQTQDSGFAIALNLKDAAASLIKTDKNGNVLWAKSYFRPRGYIQNVLENADGSLILTGNMDSLQSSPSVSPLFFVKTNDYGNVIWAKTFGDASNNIMNLPTDTKHTNDGGYITLATQANPFPNVDIIMIKLDTNCDTMWVRAHGSPQSWDCGQSIEQLNNGGYIFTGSTNNNIPVELSSLYLVRTDSLGHTDSLCEEYSPTLTITNITVNDSALSVTSIPFTITTSIPDTSTQSFTTYAYDGCHLDEIQELYLEQTAPLSIYPNPTDGAFTIEAIMKIPVKTEINIYDINCREVFSGFTSESITNIDLTGRAKGLYFVKMSNERWVKTGKVMVN